jgi:hypothetical protein
MKRQSTFTIVGWLAAVALITTLAGCGTSDYDTQLRTRLDELRAGAPFRVLFAPTSIPDTPIKIRVPQLFPKSYTAASPHPDDGPKIRADRLNPPFMELPGLRICYEGKGVDPDRGKLPYYCYICVVASKPGDAEKMAADLLAKLKETFKEAPAWENVDVRTPTDKGMQWLKLRVSSEQPFPINRGANGPKSANFPGIFELWLYDAQQYIVLVGWRTPESVQGATTTAEVKTAADLFRRASADKIDLSSLPALTAGSLVIETPPDAAATAQR